MCGICFSYSGDTENRPADDNLELLLLRRRGPDHTGQIALKHTSGSLSFISSVLSLRGESLVTQPLQDSVSGSILCWNGEAWKNDDRAIEGNDAQAVFEILLKSEASADLPPAPNERGDVDDAVVQVLRRITGPYAFIFYNARYGRIFYGRDFLGRRSLLRSNGQGGSITISSVCSGPSSGTWDEVEANGVYVIDLPKLCSKDDKSGQRHIAWPEAKEQERATSFPKYNSLATCLDVPNLNTASPVVDDLLEHLRRSLAIRINDIPNPLSQITVSAKIAILFSGGLDCTLLARIMHDLLPKDQGIDLINVAFENPRVVKVAGAGISTPVNPYSLCPDRVTGLSSHAELQQVCPGRTWRFVSVDVPYTETVAHRPQITTLIYPHNTEMDLSIACALYFAAHGSGTVHSGSSGQRVPYISAARVLISGLGADELFAGYTRHATAFSRQGFQGLSDELELDYQRLGKRNLGRDDRVISHWGREVRYPYLDEDFLTWALQLPIWEKCGFGQPSAATLRAARENDGPHVEPSKKLLRLLSWKLDMKSAATEKKRAIQFGARTAKMEAGRTKGTKVLS